jgi:hypothetical protein
VSRLAVGNDVVDLHDPRVVGKARDSRFLARVLDEIEASTVAAAPDPDLALWEHWAAKEAAYKVASKLLGAPPVFEHRAFGVRDDHVEYRGDSYPVRLDATTDFLHVVALPPSGTGRVLREAHLLDSSGARWHAPVDALLAAMTDPEAEAVHSLASAAVRVGARFALSVAMAVEESRLQIVCEPGATGRRPPRVLLDGSDAPADVSLSHHGAWIAWAIILRD